jgi:hypothetical protein
VVAASTLPLGGGAGPTINDFAFLTGTWKAEIHGGTFEETWSKPEGGTMQGYGRQLNEGKTLFMEFLSIEPDGDGLAMYIILGAPSEGDKKPKKFRLTSLKENEATFEFPENDFPNKIVYKLLDKNSMDCTLSRSRRVSVYKFKRHS